MKRIIIGAAVLVVSLALTAPAGAYLRAPTVHKGDAEHASLNLLHGISSWRYRTAGYVDCRFGKVNRTRWVCRVGWYQGHHTCRAGRIQVFSYVAEGEKWFGSHLRTRRCVGP
jgi:hypothetical protein